jgi:hypothetical protein
MSIEAMKLALDALEHGELYKKKTAKAIAALRTAIAEAEKQEPCGWQFYQDGKWHNGMETSNHKANTEDAGIPVRNVYPPPPAAQRPWVGLTDEEISELWTVSRAALPRYATYASLVDAKLRSKNT